MPSPRGSQCRARARGPDNRPAASWLRSIVCTFVQKLAVASLCKHGHAPIMSYTLCKRCLSGFFPSRCPPGAPHAETKREPHAILSFSRKSKILEQDTISCLFSLTVLGPLGHRSCTQFVFLVRIGRVFEHAALRH